MRQKQLAFYLILAGIVLFNNWTLGFVLNPHLLNAGGSVSEFSAKTQPYHQLFRLLDVTSGIFLVAGFSLSLKINKNRLLRQISAGGAILGLANIVDALLPLPCSGTLDPSCNWPVRINWQRISLPDHAFSSTIIGLLFVLIPLAAILYASASSRPRIRILGWASLVSVAFFFITLSTANSFFDNLTGYSQECQLLIFSWLIIELGLVFKRS